MTFFNPCENPSYRVTADLSSTNAIAEILIFEYIKSYTTLFPIINTIENETSDINFDKKYMSNNLENMYLLNLLRTQIQDYTFRMYTEIPSKIHWFKKVSEANNFLSKLIEDQKRLFTSNFLGR